MMPYNLSFRMLLRRYIPQVPEDALERHERLFAYRSQLRHELNYPPQNGETPPGEPGTPDPEGTGPKREQPAREQPGSSPLLEKIQRVSRLANEIFAPHGVAYRAAHKLWIARRRFALEQGHFMQIPSSPPALRRYLQAFFAFQVARVVHYPILLWSALQHRLKQVRPGQAFLSLVLLALVLLSLDQLGTVSESPLEKDIPTQRIRAGENFAPIRLDAYLRKNAGKITWSVSGGNAITARLDSNRVAHISICCENWAGEETLIFTATNEAGIAFSFAATFAVESQQEEITEKQP